MRCFRCANLIVSLPEGDPGRESGDWHYFPAAVVEVYEPQLGSFAGVLCWRCMHEVQPDMWMDRAFWETGDPAVPFAQLPKYDRSIPDHNCFQTYAAFSPKDP